MKLSCMPYEMVDFADEAAVQNWLDYTAGMLDGIDVLSVDSESPWSLVTFYRRKVDQEGLQIAMLYPRHPLIEDTRNPSEAANRRAAAGMRRDLELAEALGVSRLRYCVNPGYMYFGGVDFDFFQPSVWYDSEMLWYYTINPVFEAGPGIKISGIPGGEFVAAFPVYYHYPYDYEDDFDFRWAVVFRPDFEF